MLNESDNGHYKQIEPVFKYQVGRTYCGFATVSMILNSMKENLDVTEDKIVEEAVGAAIVEEDKIKVEGISLDVF